MEVLEVFGTITDFLSVVYLNTLVYTPGSHYSVCNETHCSKGLPRKRLKGVGLNFK